MRPSKFGPRALITVATLLALTAFTPASADWNPGDGHKMHFPQLPDPNGWDIEISSFNRQHELADDWQCSQTGPVEDIHFWTSWALGDVGTIEFIEVVIYDNVPDPDPGDPATFSRPGVELWSRIFGITEFTVVDPYGTGDQGFADPQQGPPGWVRPDHTEFQQINIVAIDNPFIQQVGEIYWLGIHVWWDSGPHEPVGWKTTLDLFEDTAVYRTDPGLTWEPLIDPLTTEPVELAFVITGQPPAVPSLTTRGLIGLVAVLLVGTTVVVVRMRRRRTA